MKKTAILKNLGVCRSTYYGWLKKKEPGVRKPSVLRLTEAEREAVYLSHRKISGYLRHEGYWISEFSCYRILKALSWIFPQPLRQAPCKGPHYEPYAPN